MILTDRLVNIIGLTLRGRMFVAAIAVIPCKTTLPHPFRIAVLANESMAKLFLNLTNFTTTTIADPASIRKGIHMFLTKLTLNTVSYIAIRAKVVRLMPSSPLCKPIHTSLANGQKTINTVTAGRSVLVKNKTMTTIRAGINVTISKIATIRLIAYI